MKKLSLLFLLLFSSFLLVACGDDKEEPVVELPTSYTVTFNTNEGSALEPQEVVEGETLVMPSEPTKERRNFVYWYETSESVEFDFSTEITEDITLNALWEINLDEANAADKIYLDMMDYLENMVVGDMINLPEEGSLYGSSIKWTSDSKYISDEGIVLSVPDSQDETTGRMIGEFSLNGTVISYDIDIPITHKDDVIIDNVTVIPFENLTTEYNVEDGSVNMYYEENGTVPYIKVVDFFNLLEGFIDPELDITFTTSGNVLEASYSYYDEDEDETYDMILTIDALENTIVVNDPAFYWAYVHTTETNYGRHIEYDFDNPLSYTDEGSEVVYDLDDFNMDIVVYEDEIVLPYYMTNQLFAGLSYYNVYYNTDGLYGIYSLPDDGSRELRTIRNSSMNNKDIPADLLIHTFDMLAFNLDNLYGLKDIMEVDTYYDLLYTQKDDLLNQDPEDFDYAIRDLLLVSIDEPHTSYGYHSYFNNSNFDGPPTNNLADYGSRVVKWYYDGLFAVDDVIAAKWNVPAGSDWAASSPNRPNYWFVDPETVMLSLDDFYTADIDESAVFDITIPESILEVDDASEILPVIAEGNKFFYYNNSTETKTILEMIVKGSSSEYVDTYKAALIDAGYVLVLEENSNAAKELGYYAKTITSDDIESDYMVQVTYDLEYDLFYVSIANYIPASYTYSWPVYINIESLVNSDSAVYMEMMMDKILEEAPDVTDIILDLSWNTGGNIGALYRIVGFITDEAFRVSGIDKDTGGYSSYYVDITGIDAYDNLTWSLLITPVSFSAANEMATIFMENELGTIIGVTSGGGACSITPILLPNGTAFTMSSNNIGAYRTGAGTDTDPYVYHNTEFGITPDIEIDLGDIYDATTLLNALSTD